MFSAHCIMLTCEGCRINRSLQRIINCKFFISLWSRKNVVLLSLSLSLSLSLTDFVLQRKMTRKSHTRRVLTPLCTEIKVGNTLPVQDLQHNRQKKKITLHIYIHIYSFLQYKLIRIWNDFRIEQLLFTAAKECCVI